MSGEPRLQHQKFVRFQSGGKSYYLFSLEVTDGIKLTVTDASSAWRGTVSIEELRVKSTEANLVDHEANSRKALLGTNTIGYEYELKPAAKHGQTQFTWKKVIEEETIKYQLGSALLDLCDDSAAVIAAVFDSLIDTTKSLDQQVATAQVVNEKLSKELSETQKTLDKCASIKEETEKNLYAKFVLVLNEKKAKIRHLKAQLEAHLSGSLAATSAAVSSSPKRGAGRRSSESYAESARERANVDGNDRTKHGGDSSIDDRDYSTDDEHSKSSSKAECTTVTSSSKRAEDSRRERTTSGSHSPFSCMMNDTVSDEDGELAVVAKRGKTGSICSESHSSKHSDHGCSDHKEEELHRIPCMLSYTGTTNTATTSSDRQRQLDKGGSSKKDSHKQQSESGRSSNVDELIGDMA